MITSHAPHAAAESPRAVFRYSAPPARGVSRAVWVVGLLIVVAALAAFWLTR